MQIKKRPYQILLENPETEGPRKLFLLENNFKTCDTVNFLKKNPDSFFNCYLAAP